MSYRLAIGTATFGVGRLHLDHTGGEITVLGLQGGQFSDTESRVRGHMVENRPIKGGNTLVRRASKRGGDEVVELLVGQRPSLPLTDVVEASNGEEALERFKQQPFQLVMTDWNMPVKTGLELVRDIRALGSRVPVMMITTKARRNGCWKPFRREQPTILLSRLKTTSSGKSWKSIAVNFSA